MCLQSLANWNIGCEELHTTCTLYTYTYIHLQWQQHGAIKTNNGKIKNTSISIELEPWNSRRSTNLQKTNLCHYKSFCDVNGNTETMITVLSFQRINQKLTKLTEIKSYSHSSPKNNKFPLKMLIRGLSGLFCLPNINSLLLCFHLCYFQWEKSNVSCVFIFLYMLAFVVNSRNFSYSTLLRSHQRTIFSLFWNLFFFTNFLILLVFKCNSWNTQNLNQLNKRAGQFHFCDKNFRAPTL